VSEEKNTYSVYMHVFPNGKIYYGITKNDPEARWREGKGYLQCGQLRMRNAILKYGWVNVTHIVLLTGLSKECAWSAERFLIERDNTMDCSCGYNMTQGGEPISSWSPETRARINAARRGKPSKLKHTDEFKRMIAESNRTRGCTPATRAKRSVILKALMAIPENVARIIAANAGVSRAVVQLDSFGKPVKEFRSLSNASVSISGDKKHAGSIRRSAVYHEEGKKRCAIGYQWAFAKKEATQ
jgi:hypothetical protein